MRPMLVNCLVLLSLFTAAAGASDSGWEIEMIGGFGSDSRNRVESLAVFDGMVWAGVYDPDDWLDIVTRPVDPHQIAWMSVVSDGFGNPLNLEVDSAVSAGKDLVVSAWQLSTGAEIWRYRGIVTDGFETGTVDAWSSATP